MSEILVLKKRFNATKSLVRQAVTDYLRTANLPHRKPLVLWTNDNKYARLSWAWVSIDNAPFSNIISVRPPAEEYIQSEDYIGDIKLIGEMPVEVELVCAYDPALEFFQHLAYHLKVYLPQAIDAIENIEEQNEDQLKKKLLKHQKYLDDLKLEKAKYGTRPELYHSIADTEEEIAKIKEKLRKLSAS